ncbi:C4-type zinc ribbon domain-containing protein [soil metagenome]
MLSDDLLALQGLDTDVDQLRYRRAHLAERLAADEAHAALATLRRRLDTLTARQAELATAVDDAEHRGTELGTHRTRLEAQLKTVIAPREAEALMHEIETIDTERSALDDAELELLEEQATVDDEIQTATAARPAANEQSQHTAAALATVEGEIDHEIAVLAERRTSIVGAVPGDVVEDYERRRAHSDGVAVARLDGRRCTGCHLDLSTGEFDEVRATPAGDVAECPQCGRMLVP